MKKFDGVSTMWHLPPDERKACMNMVRHLRSVRLQQPSMPSATCYAQPSLTSEGRCRAEDQPALHAVPSIRLGREQTLACRNARCLSAPGRLTNAVLITTCHALAGRHPQVCTVVHLQPQDQTV